MQKYFLIIAILIAVIVAPKIYSQGLQLDVFQPVAVKDISVIEEFDAREIAVRRVFERYNSPLVPYAKSYVEFADKNGVDWRLLPSISGLESTFGRFMMPNSYNAYGWGGGYIYFDSWEDGIDTINASLKKNYIDRGADTVDKIGPIYAESPTWSVRVNIFVNEIEAEYQSLNTPLILTI